MSNETVKNQGISTNAVMLPVIAILTALHLAIIILIFHINITSMRLSKLMQDSATYTETATSLLAGSSLMSETASNFVLMPMTETGEVNVSPLIAYAKELALPRRGDQVVERFRGYEVGDKALSLISAAAESADYLMDAQLHAISLVCAVHPLPNQPPLDTIPLRELTAEERALPDDGKLMAARLLLLNSQYGRNKQAVSENVNACVADMKETSAQARAEASRRIQVQRTLLWVATLAIIAILIFDFGILYRQLICPLKASARRIETDETLDDRKGLREMRMLAGAYNRLLKRREGLESILRSAASTDTLTGLSNRYAFERYMLELGQGGCALAVILFDINYLKLTNDTYGHAAGDRLIRSAAECIRECFGEEGAGNCFRFGGDEFAAVVKDVSQEDVRQRTERFKSAQKERDISVSWGCAYAPEFGETTVKALMDEADKRMYECKEAMHKELGASR